MPVLALVLVLVLVLVPVLMLMMVLLVPVLLVPVLLVLLGSSSVHQPLDRSKRLGLPRAILFLYNLLTT